MVELMAATMQNNGNIYTHNAEKCWGDIGLLRLG